MEPRLAGALVAVIGLLVPAACSGPAPKQQGDPPRAAVPAPVATFGAAAAEVTDTSVRIWSRADKASTMRVVLEGGAGAGEKQRDVIGDHDFTGSVEFADLAPSTRYRYQVSFRVDGADGAAVRGSFRTAPAADQAVPIRFAFGGDIGGQNVCRDANAGYAIFSEVARTEPDFFIALGDMIYADNRCLAVGTFGNQQVAGGFPASTELFHFWEHWRYNRADDHIVRLLSSVPYYAVWDDHEVANDFGPRGEGRQLIVDGLAAFLDYNPLGDGPLYRRVRWGKHVELFILDTRNHRDSNLSPDTPEKTMLGAEQRAWLQSALIGSDATHKIVVTSVPLAIPTGSERSGQDSWTGFGHELRGLLAALAAAGVTNTLWITTDVHFATGFRYEPFPDEPAFSLHEIVTGPMNAGLFPTTAVDPSLRPQRLFFYAPNAPIQSWSDARTWMNFGTIDVSATGELTVSVINGDGATVWQSRIPTGP